MVLRNELGISTSKHLAGKWPIILVPLGSTEQHGPHLPLDTDTRIATAVARAVVADIGRECHDPARYLIAPPIAYGAAGEHEGFAGTVSIGTTALTALLIEYGRSACRWAQRVAFVNGHGGNIDALRSAMGTLRREGRDAVWCPCMSRGADAHAGHTETSVLLHISPNDVRSELWCPGNREPVDRLLPELRRGGVAAVSEVGVLGDPTTATKEDGARILAEMVSDCIGRIARWRPGGDGMLT